MKVMENGKLQNIPGFEGFFPLYDATNFSLGQFGALGNRDGPFHQMS